jgi:ribosomal protein S18 acetylase RimI-like enzyme
MMPITYAVNEIIEVSDAVELLRRSRAAAPSDDAHRLVRIVPEANVVVTARDNGRLIGLARGLKEDSGCCYLSDLIVDRAYQSQGIGEQLIRHAHDVVGEHALILLVPSPNAMVYSAEID